MTTQLFKDYVSDHQPTDEPTIFANGEWLGLVGYDIANGTCQAVKLYFGSWPFELTNVFDVKISDVTNVCRF